MKDKIMVFIFIAYIFIFSVLGLIFKDEAISYSERRKLQTFPKFTLSSDYVNKLDKYFLDHFPFRDTYRSIKAEFNYNVLHKLDNNGIYLKDNYIFKSNYPTNYKSIDKFINIINKLQSSFNGNKYIMIIPDKNYYIDSKDFLNIDYNYIYNKINNMGLENIDIRNIMTLKDYYETDTHWKQENLDKVVQKMNEVMKFDYKQIQYNKNYYDKFYGVYYGESAINRKPEMITYLTNDIIENAKVVYMENKDLHTIYNTSKLTGIDSYDVYLDGASSYIEIYNENSISNKELVIFRDSFGSSLSPLLVPYYSKITIIDNRYINSDYYEKYLNITNQDVLFMFSTLIVNNSVTLKG